MIGVGYGPELCNVAFCPDSAPVPVRQLAGVLLKNFIVTHWHSGSPKFTSPVVPENDKILIKQALPTGLAETVSKIRTSAVPR